MGVQEDDDASETDTAARFEAYCREVEETAAWGGQIELQALAQALERHILVHSVGLPVLELGTEYKGSLLCSNPWLGNFAMSAVVRPSYYASRHLGGRTVWV